MRRLMMMAVLALGLAACTPSDPGGVVSTPAPVTQNDLMVKATQALIVAENTYTVTATAATAAVKAGVVPAASAPTLRSLNEQAGRALDAAGKAQTGAEKLRHVGGLQLITDQLKRLIPTRFLRGGG